MSEDYKLIQELANNDVKVLKEKGMTYGDSWRKRGGAGAFMMLSRKWDRVENICQHRRYDIFEAGMENVGDILDDIADLRRYLLLVEAHVTGAVPKEKGPQKWTLRQGADPNNPKAGDWVKEEEEDCGPGAGYVNQDGPARTMLPWREAHYDGPPNVGRFDTIQVMWNDGTYSAMLPHEFGKVAQWSEVRLYRVISDGTDPELYQLPQPYRQWGGSRHTGTMVECLACGGYHPSGNLPCPSTSAS